MRSITAPDTLEDEVPAARRGPCYTHKQPVRVKALPDERRLIPAACQLKPDTRQGSRSSARQLVDAISLPEHELALARTTPEAWPPSEALSWEPQYEMEDDLHRRSTDRIRAARIVSQQGGSAPSHDMERESKEGYI